MENPLADNVIVQWRLLACQGEKMTRNNFLASIPILFLKSITLQGVYIHRD